MINLALLGQQVWQTAIGQVLAYQPEVGLGRALASKGATVLTAGAIWLGYHAWSLSITQLPRWHGEAESASVLRKVYLCGIVLTCVGWSLFNAGEILRSG